LRNAALPALLTSLCAYSIPAAAQSQSSTVVAATTSAEAAPDSREEIVVTGSRIPRAGFDTLQPAQQVTGQTLSDRAFINAADALNELSAFGTPGSNNTGQQSGANVGQQFVNLYGLGAQRTLVLVNGRRFVSGNAPTPSGTFGGAPAGQEVDLNTIPAGLTSFRASRPTASSASPATATASRISAASSPAATSTRTAATSPRQSSIRIRTG